jgi:hypothetical protein
VFAHRGILAAYTIMNHSRDAAAARYMKVAGDFGGSGSTRRTCPREENAACIQRPPMCAVYNCEMLIAMFL